MSLGGGGGRKIFRKKNGIFEEIFDLFLPKNAIFSENFWDLLRLSQTCSKIFKKNLTPPPFKIFLNPKGLSPQDF
jgi:hypothetical protein